MAYTTEHDLDTYRVYFLGWRAVCHLHRGQLEAAAQDAQAALQHAGVTPVHKVLPLSVLGRVRARRGDAHVWPPLDEALELAERCSAHCTSRSTSATSGSRSVDCS